MTALTAATATATAATAATPWRALWRDACYQTPYCAAAAEAEVAVAAC